MRKKVFISLFVILTVAPLAAGLIHSLLYSLGMAGLMGKGFTFAHWKNVLTDAEVWRSLFYSAWLSFAALAVTLALSLPLAYHLYFKRPSRLAEASLFLPLTFPPIIAAFAWNYLLRPSGVISRVSHHAGITGGIEDFPRWVEDWAGLGITITHVFLIFPFFSLFFLNVARKENLNALRETSTTLGATGWSFFRKIFAPLLLMRGRTVVILYGVFLFGAYEIPLLLGKTSPRAVTVLIVDKVSRFNLGDIPAGHALAVLYAVLIGAVATALLWKNRQKMEGQRS